MAQSFRDLTVWQKAMQLTVDIYELTSRFPREEAYALTSQMRRAAVCIPSNIAEGHGRLDRSQFRHSLGIARGFNFELQTQLELARRLQLGDPDQIERSESLSNEVGKMLYAIINSVTPTTPNLKN